MENKVIQIALLGFGTVGSGVYRILQSQKDEMVSKLGAQLVVRKILVRNIEKNASKIDEPSLLTTDWNEIIEDPQIAIVIEVMGGIEPASTYIRQALKERDCLPD